MLEKKRSSAAAFPFPFFGAGDASYFEWAEVHVRFLRAPTKAEKAAIAKQVPPPLRDSVDWEGEQLMVASGQFAHVVIADSYHADPNDKSSADDDDDEDAEFGGRFFFAQNSQVTKFNLAIDEWLVYAHTQCPILAAFRHEDGESGGTKLSAWHKWSMKQLPTVLPQLQPIMEQSRDGCASYMLRGILSMAREAKSESLTTPFLDWLEPGRHERVALKAGDAKELARLLPPDAKLTSETMEAMAEAVKRCDGPEHDKELRALLAVAPTLLGQPSLPHELLVALVSGAARAMQREDASSDERALAKKVLDHIQSEASKSAELGDELANLAYWMAKKGLFLESLWIFDRLVDSEGLAKTTYCNALWVVMSDNNKLPIQPERARRYLKACVPHGPQNPAIFYNAACVYFELGDMDKVLEHLQLAIYHHYDKPEQMQSEPLFAPLREDPRFLKIFDEKSLAKTKPAANTAAKKKKAASRTKKKTAAPRAKKKATTPATKKKATTTRTKKKATTPATKKKATTTRTKKKATPAATKKNTPPATKKKATPATKKKATPAAKKKPTASRTKRGKGAK